MIIMWPGPDRRRPHFGDDMTDAKKPPDKKLIGFPGTEESVETKLLRWIRGVVQSNDQLVDALERIQRSYRVLQAGQPVPDAAETLWQVEVALRDAERS